jgi:murein L,D-transpeptidase YcbB/YkuD
VLRQGVGYLVRQNMEALSDGSQDAAVLDPATIDWSAVAAGRLALRLRQRPGDQNMMGQIKFMFPNRLGVYLHDTPFKALFAGVQRAESSGCVRLADAPRLAQWLAPDAAGRLGEAGEPEHRVDLPEPVPVYIVYFTVAADSGGVRLRDDIYGRDAALLAQIDDAPSAGTRAPAEGAVWVAGR